MDLNLGMMGGSADLTGSTGLVKRDQDVWKPKERPGPFIHFGVRNLPCLLWRMDWQVFRGCAHM